MTLRRLGLPALLSFTCFLLIGCSKDSDTPKYLEVEGRIVSIDQKTGVVRLSTRTKKGKIVEFPGTLASDAEIMINGKTARQEDVFVNDRVIAASMSAMPHAGRDDKPAEIMVSNRSLGYGYGHNLDKIKNNGMDGVCDLHFAGSTRHLDGNQDSRHQQAIRVAAGLDR